MKEDLSDFWDALPPEARQVVENIDNSRARAERKRMVARRPGSGQSIEEFESFITGGSLVEDDVPPPEKVFEDESGPVRESAPAPARKRRSMRDLIESVEKK